MSAMVRLEQTLFFTSCFAGMYDEQVDEQYVPAKKFRAYSGNRLSFVFQSVFRSFVTDELIIGHMNLAVIGVCYKFFRPNKKLIVICHGIEVFEPVTGLKKKLLQKADRILAVSSFTRQKLIDLQDVPQEKIIVFPNTIDPHFALTTHFSKPAYLQQRYGIHENEKVIFTLTRLNSEEGYKGYDKLISILPQLLQDGLQVKYILAGKADTTEAKRMQELISTLKLEHHVLMPGFIPDEEVNDHYLLSDVFVMPSKGEGFGIVFLEAMACGLPVIAGNKDGSTEALQFGELGTLIDPDSQEQLRAAIKNVLQQKKESGVLQQKMLSYFSFDKYKERLQQHLRA